MSELKYKVGDKFFVEVEIEAVEDSGGSRSYLLKSNLLYNSIWKTKSLVDSLLEANKPLDCMRPQVTQKVVDYYNQFKDGTWGIEDYVAYAPEELDGWLYDENNKLKNQHALATLIAYGPEAVEVEKEKKYRVKLNLTNQILIDLRGDYVFA